MPRIGRTSRVAAVLLLGAAACSSTDPGQSGIWGSAEASLTIEPAEATLQILASGGCYGSYGVIAAPVPAANFSLAGTYTQLTGVYPGHVDHAARFDGTVAGSRMTLTITVAEPPLTIGPFELTHGVNQTWPACLYP
jgi:hypothetical protein